jgi:hypothetical protein
MEDKKQPDEDLVQLRLMIKAVLYTAFGMLLIVLFIGIIKGLGL